jgi:hypothetical protein
MHDLNPRGGATGHPRGCRSLALVDRVFDETRVLDSFVKDGRLVTVPARRRKRQVVLNHVAQRFQIGRRYSESEVNAILRPFHDDVASLRRYLVDEVFLDRENGVYWRSGGTVDV